MWNGEPINSAFCIIITNFGWISKHLLTYHEWKFHSLNWAYISYRLLLYTYICTSVSMYVCWVANKKIVSLCRPVGYSYWYKPHLHKCTLWCKQHKHAMLGQWWQQQHNTMMLNNSDANNDQTMKNGQSTGSFTLWQQAAQAWPSRVNGDNNSENNGAQQLKNR